MIRRKTLTLLLPLTLLGCAAPRIYDAQSGQVSIRPASLSLVRQGNQAFAQYKSTHRVSNDANARTRVARVANRLSSAVHLPNARWEFEVFADPSANAFALPGGKVGINTGLLKVAKTDGQLAAVIAHEMAHVTSNHAQTRIRNNQAIAMGGVLVGALLGGDGATQTASLATDAGNLVFGKTFSRSQELQADRIGTIFMARAGFDPAEAVDLWRNMAAAKGGSGSPEFLSTHPVSATRIQALQEFLPEARRASPSLRQG